MAVSAGSPVSRNEWPKSVSAVTSAHAVVAASDRSGFDPYRTRTRPAAPGQAPSSADGSPNAFASPFFGRPTAFGPAARVGDAVSRVQTTAAVSVTSPTFAPLACRGAGDGAACA